MKRVICICLALALSLGCTRHHRMGEMNDVDRGYFEKRIEREAFTVVLQDGHASEGRELAVGADSIAWVELAGGATTRVASSEVRHIMFFSRTRGMGDGFIGGLGVGALIGGVLGFMGGEDDCGEGGGQEFDICFTHAQGVFIGALLLGVPSALIGMTVGATRGSTDYYYPGGSDPEDTAQHPESGNRGMRGCATAPAPEDTRR